LVSVFLFVFSFGNSFLFLQEGEQVRQYMRLYKKVVQRKRQQKKNSGGFSAPQPPVARTYRRPTDAFKSNPRAFSSSLLKGGQSKSEHEKNRQLCKRYQKEEKEEKLDEKECECGNLEDNWELSLVGSEQGEGKEESEEEDGEFPPANNNEDHGRVDSMFGGENVGGGDEGEEKDEEEEGKKGG
jgi:hypothetical protein